MIASDCPLCGGVMVPILHHIGRFDGREAARFDDEWQCQGCFVTCKDHGRIGEPDLRPQEDAA